MTVQNFHPILMASFSTWWIHSANLQHQTLIDYEVAKNFKHQQPDYPRWIGGKGLHVELILHQSVSVTKKIDRCFQVPSVTIPICFWKTMCKHQGFKPITPHKKSTVHISGNSKLQTPSPQNSSLYHIKINAFNLQTKTNLQHHLVWPPDSGKWRVIGIPY